VGTREQEQVEASNRWWLHQKSAITAKLSANATS
jgi:hypothetical protein